MFMKSNVLSLLVATALFGGAAVQAQEDSTADKQPRAESAKVKKSLRGSVEMKGIKQPASGELNGKANSSGVGLNEQQASSDNNRDEQQTGISFQKLRGKAGKGSAGLKVGRPNADNGRDEQQTDLTSQKPKQEPNGDNNQNGPNENGGVNEPNGDNNQVGQHN